MELSSEEFAGHFETHFRGTTSFLKSLGCSFPIAEEVAQRAWCRAWTYREQWNGMGAFHSWVLGIARNEFRRFVSSEARLIQIPEELNDKGDVAFTIYPSEREILERIDLERILERIHPSRCRFVRYFWAQHDDAHTIGERVRAMRMLRDLKLMLFDPDKTKRTLMRRAQSRPLVIRES